MFDLSLLLKRFLFCLLVVINSTLCGQLFFTDEGTIIVTYQTTAEGKRLDRIRFWLINDAGERTLYPKKDEFVSHTQTKNDRTVVITHLPTGDYKVEFLIPNTDSFFEPIPLREISLSVGDVVKIDQTIKPKEKEESSSLLLPQVGEDENSEVGLVIYNRPYPILSPYPSKAMTSLTRRATFSLKSNRETSWKLLLNGRVVYAGRGSVSTVPIPPGQNYYLVAEDLPGYSFYTSPKVPFNVMVGQDVKMKLLYQKGRKS